MRSLEWAPLWVIFNMTDVLVRGGDWDTDTQEGRPSQDSGRGWPSACLGVSHPRKPARPRSGSWTPAPQNGGISVWCLSLAVCGTPWWQPWNTNVVTIISQIIPQNEMFLKCVKMFSDLNMDEYILCLWSWKGLLKLPQSTSHNIKTYDYIKTKHFYLSRDNRENVNKSQNGRRYFPKNK